MESKRKQKLTRKRTAIFRFLDLGEAIPMALSRENLNNER